MRASNGNRPLQVVNNSLLAQVEASLEEAFSQFRSQVFHTVSKLAAASSTDDLPPVFEDVSRSGNGAASTRPNLVRRSTNDLHDAKCSSSSVKDAVQFADPELCSEFAEWAARLEIKHHSPRTCGHGTDAPKSSSADQTNSDDDAYHVFPSESSRVHFDAEASTNIRNSIRGHTSLNSAADMRKSLQAQHTQSQTCLEGEDDDEPAKFDSRPSVNSETSMASLRQEFHLHRQQTRANQILSPVFALTEVFSRATERFEAKELHFDKLAFERMGSGMCWKDLSTSDQVKIIREELTPKFCLVDPGSDLMKFWDMLTVVCLMFTALVCPYEIAFLDFGYDPVYFLNHIIDVIFLWDMILQFFLKVQVRTRQGKVWVRERHKIAALYLRSWFILDLISIIPYDDISNMASDDSGPQLEHLKLMRLLRVLRLFKLTRMLKASRLAKRWEDRISLLSSSRFLLKCSILVLVSIHWMACIWGFLGMWEGTNLKCRSYLEADDPLVSERGTWFVDLDEGQAPNEPSAWRGQSWVVTFAQGRASRNPINPCDHPLVYLVSVYWAIMTMTSIGYGDILPQVLSEYIVCCACMMLSGILWAYIVGAASAVLSNMYPEVTEFEQRMDAFNSMVQEMQVPKKIRLRGREYIRESRSKANYERNLQAIQGLGMDLQAHISKQKAELHLSKVTLFNDCGVLFKGDCAAKMVPLFFEQREVLQLSNQLCVVERGAVGHCGRVLVPWSHWGEDFIVNNSLLQSRAPVIAINNAMVVSLSKNNAEDVLLNHPHERQLFRKAGVRMAFKAAMRIYCFEKRSQEIMLEHRWIHELIEDSSNPLKNGTATALSGMRPRRSSAKPSLDSGISEQLDTLVGLVSSSHLSSLKMNTSEAQNDLLCRLLEAVAPNREEPFQRPLPVPPTMLGPTPETPPESPRGCQTKAPSNKAPSNKAPSTKAPSTAKLRTPRVKAVSPRTNS